MLRIRGARVIDPSAGTDASRDIFIRDGKIAPPFDVSEAETLDAAGLVAAPGLVDMHVHLRDPGFTYKEDIFSGAAAAAAGGVTTVACMPNTKPVLDDAETIRYVLEKAKSALITVLPYGAVTLGQGGAALADYAALKAAGAVALSDDGNPVMSAAVLRRAMILAKERGLFISSHCEDAELVGNYAVNEGRVSEALGIPGRPAIAEELMVARDCLLARETGARVHIAHVSAAGSVEILRRAKADGVAVTAETCPQYFTLTEDEILKRGSLARVNPPLRTAADAAAVIEGLRDGTIDAVVTDHAPHSAEEKARPLTESVSGMIGLETSLAVTLTALYHTKILTLAKVMDILSFSPAKILRAAAGTLAQGAIADLVIFDPEEQWVAEPEKFKSKARNTPFGGVTLRGRVKYTISRGKIVYRGE